MGWLRRERASTSTAVELYTHDRGVLVQGDPGAVAVFVDQMLATTSGVENAIRRVAPDGVALGAHALSLAQAHRQYFELSPQALELVRSGELVPTADGFFRSMVRSGGKIAGNVDWKPADLQPQQALALQTMAVHLALRAAIKDVVEAIERVEGKVDKLIQLARAERLGDAMGDRITLGALAERARVTGKVSVTDWSTVDALGAQIARDTETLRAYVLREAADADKSRLVRSRSSELADLTDELLRESLALLVVAEQNYILWQEIRVAHVASNEPQALADTVADVRTQLAALRRADQHLIDELHDTALGLLQSTGFEGLAPWGKKKLQQRGEEMERLLDWFGEQRQLEAPDIDSQYPSLSESIREARRLAGRQLVATRKAIGSTTRKALERGADKDPD